ncbi:MAG: thiamine pyrophosphate-dependent dehydrogenase E1 component subunit alpha [Betaproteobacteria bacterium]|nr:MAG: thiamine pyrophosphate-dependent dehydrogenase E1 component subunit alpha [Betaproteobacteria bacterium]
MARIRAFENAAEEASKGGVAAFGASLSQAQVRGPLHLSTGQEAVAAGVCVNLRKEDFITSTHRGHGHTLAKGASMERMMCELFGRATGFNRGKGGSMHIADFSVGMLGANGVVAAGMPIAVGAAHAIKIRGEKRIVACFFGDGAVNRGPFLEALNWAAIHALPLLFICEDNRWSATTATDTMTAGEGALARARAIGVPGEQVDGNDVFTVDQEAAGLLEKVRRGEGPQFLHAITYRFKGHVSVDPAAYRDGGELSRALENDPLILAGKNLPPEDARRIREAAENEVKRALEIAAAAPWPPAVEAYQDVQDTGSGQWR